MGSTGREGVRTTAWLAPGVAVCAALVAVLALARAPDDRAAADPAGADAAPAAPAPLVIADGAADRAALPAPDADPLPLAPAPTTATAARARMDPASDPADATDRSPRPGTERAFRARYEEVAREGGAALDAAAEDVFGRAAPDAERVALLAVLWEHGTPSAAGWFAHAMRVCREHAGAATGHETVASFAVGWLAARAGGDPAAGDLLADYVREAPSRVDEDLRRRAAAALAAAGTREQLVRLAADVAPSDDLRLVQAVVAALPRNARAEDVEPLYAPLEARLPDAMLAAGRAAAVDEREEDG